MSYPVFGKVKTIVLPVPTPDDAISLQQYKDRYGIDLKDFLVLEPDYGLIDFIAPKDSIVLFNTREVSEHFEHIVILGLDVLQESSSKPYNVDTSSNAELNLVFTSVNMQFYIRYTDDFTIDNILIQSSEV